MHKSHHFLTEVILVDAADTQPPKGTSVLAYAPLYPFPKPEKWNFVLADALSNTVYARVETALLEAEAAAMALRRDTAKKPPLLLTGAGEGTLR